MAGAAGEMQLHQSFFESLGHDELAKVFRFLSARPNHPRWARHIASSDFISFLRLGDAFMKVVRTVLVRVGNGDCIVPFHHLREVIQAAGDKLQELVVFNYFKQGMKQ